MSQYDTGIQRECIGCNHPIVQTYDDSEKRFGWRHLNIAPEGCDPTPPPNDALNLLPMYYRLDGPCSLCGRSVPVVCVPLPDEINLSKWFCREHIPSGALDLAVQRHSRTTVAEANREACLWACQLIMETGGGNS